MGTAFALHGVPPDEIEGLVFWVFVAGMPFSIAVGFYGVVANGFIPDFLPYEEGKAP